MGDKIRHRFRVREEKDIVGRDGKHYHVFPIVDETGGVWTNGHILGTYTAVYDMPYAMPKSESEAWAQLPPEIEIAPPDTELHVINIDYQLGLSEAKWDRWFVEPDVSDEIFKALSNNNGELVGFMTFQRYKVVLNPKLIARLMVRPNV